jgi:hypothetical protein
MFDKLKTSDTSGKTLALSASRLLLKQQTQTWRLVPGRCSTPAGIDDGEVEAAHERSPGDACGGQ